MKKSAIFDSGRSSFPRWIRFSFALLVTVSGLLPSTFAATLGDTEPASFSLCESATDGSGVPRPECQGADVRFQAPADAAGSTAPASTFGWAIGTGKINGDSLADLVVGDPGRNKVYVFFGRLSVKDGYGLDPASLSARMVDADAKADVILSREPFFPGQVGSFGFSVAVGKQPVAGACGSGLAGGAVLIGAPGNPGTTGNSPGTAFYIPAGKLCGSASDPPVAIIQDPEAIGQAIQSSDYASDDEFGYSVALGRLLVNTGTEEDVIVGARGALSGGGRVTAFPVTNKTVGFDPAGIVRIEGTAPEGLGEVMAVGDLDQDFDATLNPNGKVDDLVIGAVGQESGKVLLVQGPLSPTGGSAADGTYRDGEDIQIKRIEGEASGDYFGFSVAVSAQGHLAVGAVFADNVMGHCSLQAAIPCTTNTICSTLQRGTCVGTNEKTNVPTGGRINGGKVYLWDRRNDAPVFPDLEAIAPADSANAVLVARRSGDQLGFGVAFGDLDGSGEDDFIATARREDGPALNVNQIDRGTAYVLLDQTTPASPLDLNKCSGNSDCTGVSGVHVMVFGSDRGANLGDEIGYAVAAGDFNGDSSADLFLSSITHQRVFTATIQDQDDDRIAKGRNIRDDDDDNDTDPDGTDCAPLNANIKAGATEVLCNKVDENCNGLADDAPDTDGDGYDACAPVVDPGDKDGKIKDCNDSDPNSYPTATERCDGNNNACTAVFPASERDVDGDGYVTCTGWADSQGDNSAIKGGGDCDDQRGDIFPGAAPRDSATACMKDTDGDDFGDRAPASSVVTDGTDCDDRANLGVATFPGSAEKESLTECRKDTDGDGYGDVAVSLPVVRGGDCNDNDGTTYVGAPEHCDGNDNACAGTLPANEGDSDGDKYVQCTPWADVQADNPTILGGADCDPADGKSFPGAGRNEVLSTACMKDKDGDGFGELTPPAGITPGTDCDDASATGAVTFPGAAQIEGPLNCMKDGDDDGYGDGSVALPVAAGSDCNDSSAATHPGGGAQNPPAPEVPDDGVDQDCNGFDQVTCYGDQDHDGYGAGTAILNEFGGCTAPDQSRFDTDCNDASPAINPSIVEIAGDGIDQNCNGHDAISCIQDSDKDGHGTVSGAVVIAEDGVCDTLQQESASADDCDDLDANSHPGATEKCDGDDNTCSGTIPANEIDTDGDHYVACTGWADTQGNNPGIAGGGDCDSADPDTFPGAAPKEVFASACMKDKDGDDYGDISPPAGVVRGADCDDSSATAQFTFPGAAQIEAPLNCMKDQDEDGYGDASVAFPIVKGKDCNDTDSNVHPGATELCDGKNNSCSASLPAGETDPDGDHYVACSPWVGNVPGIQGGGDCDPADVDTFPGASPNEAVSTACTRDKDGDGYGDFTPPAGVTPGTDCDDQSAAAAFIFPGAAQLEVGGSQVCMRDQDDDGWGDSTAILPVVAGVDCADTDAATYPGAPELCDGKNTGCTGAVPAGELDADGDGFVACTPWVGTNPTVQGGGDCDTSDADTFPGAAPSDSATACLRDEDGDNFGAIAPPAGVTAGSDCADVDPARYPGAPELCDGIDNACAGPVPAGETDPDGDGYVACAAWAGTNPAIQGGGDCNPADPATHPGAVEACDGNDNACAGTVPVGETDPDGDFYVACSGWGDSQADNPGILGGDDCDPADADTFPGAAPSDSATACLRDKDGDNYGEVVPPAGVTPGTDCADDDSSRNPGATEICGDGVDSDCDGQDTVCPSSIRPAHGRRSGNPPALRNSKGKDRTGWGKQKFR